MTDHSGESPEERRERIARQLDEPWDDPARTGARVSRGAMPVGQLGESSAIAVCKVCGMPVRAVFAEGELRRVLAPCGHVTMPGLPTVGADEQPTTGTPLRGRFADREAQAIRETLAVLRRILRWLPENSEAGQWITGLDWVTLARMAGEREDG